MTDPRVGGKETHRGETRRWSRLAAVVLLIPAVSACPKDCPVTEIEVVPSSVVVESDPVSSTSFELEARLWTGTATARKSMLPSADCPVQWTAHSALSWLHVVGSPTGLRATLKIDPGVHPVLSGFIKAKAGGKITTPGTEVRVVPASVTDQDIVHGVYSAGAPASAALVNGSRVAGGGPSQMQLSAFVRSGLVGSLVDGTDAPPWTAAVLDPRQAMVMYSGSLDAPNAEVPPLPVPPVPLRRIPVALRVRVDAVDNPAEALTFAKLDLEAANSILAESRVGVAFDFTDIATITPTGAGPVIADCLTGDELTPAGDRPTLLHVIYVSAMGGATGLTCAATDERPHATIYISKRSYYAATLVHEFGHVLGLVMPQRGHTEALSGFDGSNVMAGENWDTDPLGRQRLTVGQAFRMNADAGSWLNWATDDGGHLIRPDDALRLECQCGHNDPTGFCPRVVDDVARARGGSGASNPWDCYDRLQLPWVEASEDVTGVVAGRQWRDPPGTCTAAIPGTRVDHWGASFLQFRNLTRPGTCPSWAAVFFGSHAPVYQDLTETTSAAWTDVSEQRALGDALAAKLTVRVNLYYLASQEIQVKEEGAAASQTFGSDNPTGLDLSITYDGGTAVPNPCPANPPGGFSICYPDGGSTVSQLVGAALGLPPLTAIDQSKSAYAANAMQPAAATPNQHLTLGQLVHIHSSLRTAGFPDCTAEPKRCPPLEADGSP